eukprot:3102580-Pyramimonas_sp.AAC.1
MLVFCVPPCWISPKNCLRCRFFPNGLLLLTLELGQLRLQGVAQLRVRSSGGGIDQGLLHRWSLGRALCDRSLQNRLPRFQQLVLADIEGDTLGGLGPGSVEADLLPTLLTNSAVALKDVIPFA